MTNLVNPLLKINEYNELLESVKNYYKPVSLVGPSDSQKAHICHAILRHTSGRGIFIAYNEMQARKLYEDFSFFLGDDVLFFPSKEIMLYDVEAKSYDSVYQRIRVLDRAMKGEFTVIVTSAEAVSHKLIPPGFFRECSLELTLGSRVDMREISRKLVMMAYEKADVVERAGQFAIRGGILDIFSIDSENAVRIELFDDEVDSVRHFDVNTQRSFDKLQKVRIISAREILYSDDRLDAIINEINNDLAKHSKKSPELSGKIKEDIERIKDDRYFPGIDRYIPYIVENPCSLTDYSPEDTLVFVDEPVRQKQRVENILLEHYEICRGLMEKARIMPHSQDTWFDYEAQTLMYEKRKLD